MRLRLRVEQHYEYIIALTTLAYRTADSVLHFRLPVCKKKKKN